MHPYRHIFFDLDRTLWDFEANSEEMLRELFEDFALEAYGIGPFEKFLESYRGINADYWRAHREGRVGKDELRYERFHHTLLRNGISDRKLADRLAEAYLSGTPEKGRLVPGALDLLEPLSYRYRIHLVTNGYADTQIRKVANTGLENYIDVLVTSDRAGARKPDPAIFNYALDQAGSRKEDALMVGDDVEADIMGAMDLGIDQVFFDPFGNKADPGASFRIRTLPELIVILAQYEE